MKTVNAHARSQRPLAERSREQAEDSFPVAARYVLSVMEEPEPSTTVGCSWWHCSCAGVYTLQRLDYKFFFSYLGLYIKSANFFVHDHSCM